MRESNTKRQKVVMGNWKLNGSKQMVSELINGLKSELKDVSGVTVAVAPPFLYLDQATQLLAGSAIKLGAQNVDLHATGAFTGDISPVMLKEMGATHIIIGHSERRQYHHESDEFIANKFAFLKEHGLVPVFCIGESDEENKAGKTEAVLFRQLDAVLKTQGAAALTGAIIAYEPIWAIGTGRAATSEQAQAIHKAIRTHIASYDKDVANKVIIQYGGSVKASNAAELFAMDDIDGALVGGAALDAKEFSAIVKAASAS